jgi:hypothetical protein
MSASTPPPSPQPQVGQHRPSTPPVLVTKTIENWKDRIVYRVPSGAKEENLMIDFVNQHFVPYEPLNVSVNMCEPGYRSVFKFIYIYIKHPVSVILTFAIMCRLSLISLPSLSNNRIPCDLKIMMYSCIFQNGLV